MKLLCRLLHKRYHRNDHCHANFDGYLPGPEKCKYVHFFICEECIRTWYVECKCPHREPAF